jgi:hypothetical protein
MTREGLPQQLCYCLRQSLANGLQRATSNVELCERTTVRDEQGLVPTLTVHLCPGIVQVEGRPRHFDRQGVCCVKAEEAEPGRPSPVT